jgi:RNA polymerase sigma-70 factor (ECF subfamily)
MPQVVNHIKKLDVVEFKQLFNRLQPPLFAYCCKYINDNEQAKDIVQDCFSHLWENRDNIVESYDAYLFRSAHNGCISYLRSVSVHANYEVSTKQKLREMEIHPETPYPLTELYVKDINEILQHCLENLPEKCRLVFMMSRNQGMKNQEIADKLGMSVRTVEAQIYHALKIIKEELKDYMPFIALFFTEL